MKRAAKEFVMCDLLMLHFDDETIVKLIICFDAFYDSTCKALLIPNI